MEQSMITPLVKEAVEAIKTAIQQTRYNVMRHANKELLSLYYGVGGYLSQQASVAKWGDKVLDSISDQLQQEMPGLRGFSKGNIKKMRKFYEEWMPIFGSLSTNQNDPISIAPDPINIFSDPIKQRLYQAVLRDGSLNYAGYAALIGVSEATVKRRLNELKKEGAIVRIGSNKTGHWEIKK